MTAINNQLVPIISFPLLVQGAVKSMLIRAPSRDKNLTFLGEYWAYNDIILFFQHRAAYILACNLPDTGILLQNPALISVSVTSSPEHVRATR